MGGVQEKGEVTVRQCANIGLLKWTITFFNDKVLADIRSWPVGIHADFLRLVGLLEEFGLDLRNAALTGHGERIV